ncbi:hypothetical protein AV530_017174 [Patagioenas fasciata monilis]|uniref:Uncharacterized protein n=1 Tax=Patagioenas fasciata monilis TaxID=372326 RepID=A0A1V4JF10_PATFA|nr:hypothetical protein AV530_017174 [Patagioenas fasciata monilis]
MNQCEPSHQAIITCISSCILRLGLSTMKTPVLSLSPAPGAVNMLNMADVPIARVGMEGVFTLSNIATTSVLGSRKAELLRKLLSRSHWLPRVHFH